MKDTPNKSLRVLAVGGFLALASLCGAGVLWVGFAITANTIFKSKGDSWVDHSVLALVIGGAVGLIAGAVISVAVLRMSGQVQEEVIGKYIGTREKMLIYFGAPMGIVVLLGPLVGPSVQKVFGNGDIYVGLVLVLAFIAGALFVYDRLSPKYAVAVGIAGWIAFILRLAWFGFEQFHEG
jgi:hypothetical protein